MLPARPTCCRAQPATADKGPAQIGVVVAGLDGDRSAPRTTAASGLDDHVTAELYSGGSDIPPPGAVAYHEIGVDGWID